MAWPLAARAQHGERMRRIGVLMASTTDDPDSEARIAAFLQGLQQLGWTEGRNIKTDFRWAEGDVSRMSTLAAELIALAPDVLVATNTTTLRALQRATRALPIVFANVTDPVALGFAESLARPGGNITGFTNREYAMGGKWLEILREIAPHVTRVQVIHNPQNPASVALSQAIQTAPQSGTQLISVGVRDAPEIERAVQAFAGQPNGGLIVVPDGLMSFNREAIVALTARYQLPAIYPVRIYVLSGGLISYGQDAVDLQRRTASYVDRILNGDKPADLPIQAATKFELVINLKTAKALGLTVPSSLLARADEVIE